MNQITFKSDIGISLIGFIGGHVIVLIVTVGLLALINEFVQMEFDPIYLILLVPYTMVVYLFAGLFNNDIIIDDTKIEIVNAVPLFRKRISFHYSSVKMITLRHDWAQTFGKRIKSARLRYVLLGLTETFFPENYKWIKIETDKVHRFYCFGLQYDYYDNEGPLFEDLYRALRKKHASVKWTNETDSYYAELVKETE